MKLKNKVNALTLSLAVLLSVSVVAAHAEQKEMYCQGMVCSETPPSPSETGVFAIVDPVTNNVVAVIPGNIAYFGKNDKTMDGEYQGCPSGCKIILQAPSDPVTGNVAGAISSGDTKVTYSPTDNSFTVQEHGTTTKVISAPTIATVESSTVVSTVDVTFSSNSSATVTASDVTVVSSAASIVQESIVFNEPTTSENVINAIIESKKTLLQSRIERIMKAMGDWFI